MGSGGQEQNWKLDYSLSYAIQTDAAANPLASSFGTIQYEFIVTETVDPPPLPVPEPGAAMLYGVGVAIVALQRRRRKI